MPGQAEQASLQAELERRLADIESASLYRRRRVIAGGHGPVIRIDDRDYLNFCSNDYLGLAEHAELKAAGARAMEVSGSGSGASQLITGHNHEHAALEEELADYCGTERALYFSTGYAANVGTLDALLGREDAVIADALNHASLIDGTRLCGARKLIYRHGDVVDATGKLNTPCAGNRLLLTDSVFSMDGDCARLAVLGSAARRARAWFMVDDAHGFGVLADGRGAFHGKTPGKVFDAVVPPPDIYVATLGKAAGAAGAFVAGSEALIEYLVQRARSYVFSTAPPPSVAAAARAGLKRLREDHWRRERLAGLTRRFRAGARQIGLPLSDSATPIQPIILGEPEQALAMSESLRQQGVLVTAIRPPTVPRGSARLRVTLTAGHNEQQVDQLLDALRHAMKPLVEPAG